MVAHAPPLACLQGRCKPGWRQRGSRAGTWRERSSWATRCGCWEGWGTLGPSGPSSEQAHMWVMLGPAGPSCVLACGWCRGPAGLGCVLACGWCRDHLGSAACPHETGVRRCRSKARASGWARPRRPPCCAALASGPWSWISKVGAGRGAACGAGWVLDFHGGCTVGVMLAPWLLGRGKGVSASALLLLAGRPLGALRAGGGSHARP